MFTERPQKRGRVRIGEKSPISLARLAVQNFNDLQRTTRYNYGKESGAQSRDLERSPRQTLPKLKNSFQTRWVSLDVTSATNKKRASGQAQEFKFNVPESRGASQRVSLDYEKLQSIIHGRQRKADTMKSPQKEIVNLVHKLKQQKLQETHVPLMSTKIPQIISAQQNSAALFSSFNTQNQFGDTNSNITFCQTTRSLHEQFQPANATYPESSSHLMCNYFGANDYKKKRRLQDVKDTVAVERLAPSKRKQSKEGKDGLETDGTEVNWPMMAESSSLSPRRLEYPPIQGKKFDTDTKMNDQCSRKIAVLITTPVISNDNNSYDAKKLDQSADVVFNHLDLGQLDVTYCNSPKQSSRQSKELETSRLQVSTQLFNAAYLLKTIEDNQSMIQKRFSPKFSTTKVPQQIVQENSLEKLRIKKKKSKNGKQQRSHQRESPNEKNQSSSNPSPNMHQINLHVHFGHEAGAHKANLNKEESRFLMHTNNASPVSAKKQSKKDVAWQLSSKIIAYESSWRKAHSGTALNDEASKQTLNQSSSKGLITSNKQISNRDSPPFNVYRLNKYSSLDATESSNAMLSNQTRLLQRQSNKKLENFLNEKSASGIKCPQDKHPAELLGVNLNSSLSSRTSQKLQSDSQMKNSQDAKNLSDSLSEWQRNQTCQTKQLATIEVQARVETPTEGTISVCESSDKKQAEKMINELLHRLTQDDKTSNTINISSNEPMNTLSNESESRQGTKMSQAKQNKMRRNNMPKTQSPFEPKTNIENQLSMYKMMVKRFGEGNQGHQGMHNMHKKHQQFFNTVSEGFGNVHFAPFTARSKEMEQLMRQTVFPLGTGGVMANKKQSATQHVENQTGADTNTLFSGDNKKFSANTNRFSLFTNQQDLISILPHSKEELKPSLVQKKDKQLQIATAVETRSIEKLASESKPNSRQFDPHQMLNPSLTARAAFRFNFNSPENKGGQRYKPLSLETKLDQLAQTNKESTVLFRVNPQGEVGRFRQRARRKPESQVQRNIRLGKSIPHLSTFINKTSPTKANKDGKNGANQAENYLMRHSVDAVMESTASACGSCKRKIKGRKKISTRALNGSGNRIKADLALNQSVTVPQSAEGLSPITKSTFLQALEGKHTSNIQTMVDSQGDQVIFEEGLDDRSADYDDYESYVSGALSTFGSQQTMRIQGILCHSSSGLPTDSTPLPTNHPKQHAQDNFQRAAAQSSKRAQDNQSRKKRLSSSQLGQDTDGSPCRSPKRLSKDQSLVDRVRQIQNSNKRLNQQVSSGMLSPYRQLQDKQNLSSKAIIVHQILSNKNTSNFLLRNSNQKLSPSKPDRIMMNPQISPSEVLEGHQINPPSPNQRSSIRKLAGVQEKTFSMSPARMKLDRYDKINKSHLVVVQPQQIRDFEDFKQQLDIKIRCPSKLLSPEVIRALNGKLELSVSLIYYDGSYDLKKIQSGLSPCFKKKNLQLNAQGFAISSDSPISNSMKTGESPSSGTIWNLFDHFFRGQLSLDDLNFTKRQYIVEIELLEPHSQLIYTLRYLTFNKLTATTYPKIYIAIMHHLVSKKRPLMIYNAQPQEVLDFKKELAYKNRKDPFNQLFKTLIMRDANQTSPAVTKKKFVLDCPVIRMKGIILESPKHKVYVKSLTEYMMVGEETNLSKKNSNAGQQKVQLRKYESRHTLMPAENFLDQQSAALPMTSVEQKRSLQIREYDEHRRSRMRSAMSKTHTSSTERLNENSPKESNLLMDQRNSRCQKIQNFQNTSSQFITGQKVQQDDGQQIAINPSMHVKKITECQFTKKMNRNLKEKPLIIKKQLYIDPNLEQQSINCSYEALGSSEGRHSDNVSTPTESQRSGRIKTLNRGKTSSPLKRSEVGSPGSTKNNYHYVSIPSELEDETGETFGLQDRLQSIFSIEQQDKVNIDTKASKIDKRQLIVQGSSKEVIVMALQTSHSRDRKTSPKKQKKNKYVQPCSRETFKIPSKVNLNAKKSQTQDQSAEIQRQISFESQTSNDIDTVESVNRMSSIQKVDIVPSLRVSPEKKPYIKKDPPHQAIFNLNAEEVIKETFEHVKKKSSGLGSITSKTLPRRSNLRHALADERSKQLLQKPQPFTVNSIQLQKNDQLEALQLLVQKANFKQPAAPSN